MKSSQLGTFIHWGAYSKAGGRWNGETNHHEWLQFTAQIPLAEYTQYAKTFDPKDFDPNQWGTVAKNAGMKYLVITSKHHDGIAMYDSKSSEHNIVDLAGLATTPSRRRLRIATPRRSASSPTTRSIEHKVWVTCGLFVLWCVAVHKTYT